MNAQTGPMRAVVVDDEPLAIKLMEVMLADFGEVEVIERCRNGREAVRAVRELAPDLLFLDIQMPGMTGFDVVKELQSDTMPMVVFCTAYDAFAVDAFDLHAVDYLLKPVDEDRLGRAIARAVQRRGEDAEGEQTKSQLIGAIDDISRRVAGGLADDKGEDGGGISADRKIAIKDQDSTVLVSVDDIDWIDAAGDYMCIHVSGETHIMRSTLKSLMEKLDPEKFKRIHRSTVVNLDRIVKATAQSKGEYLLLLDCEHELKVSRNYRMEIRNFLNEH